MGFSAMADKCERFRPIALETNDCSGSVWRCYDEWTGIIVSVNKIYAADMNRIAALMREVTLLLELNHPNIIRFVDVVMYSDNIELVSEHFDCDMLMYIEKNQQMLTQDTIRDFLRQILQGLAYCHSKNIVHGKLSPKNLLIDCTSSTVKLSGLGLAGTDAVCHTTNHLMVQPESYTPWEIASAYKAPEVLLLPDDRSFPADVWSAGCILALLLTRQHLFIMKNKQGHIPSTTQQDHIIRTLKSKDLSGKLDLSANSDYTLTSSSLFDNAVARNGSPPWREDDKDGHYMFAVGENLTSRYKIHSKMGEGTFGQVLECWDRERKEMVAIKIVRGIKKYREAAMIEIEMLQQLGKHDRGGERCVQLRNWFDYRNHICIVFEKLGSSLYDFLRKNNYRSFPIDLVREIGRQLLECIAFMHDLQLIHTDLKPENILLVSSDYVKVPDYRGSSRSPRDSSYFKRVPKSSAIKVIDFGSTTYDRQDQSYIVSTRHYRAPEVILGMGWSYPCDVWSIGCILVELCTGEALFQTHENLEHLAMMERVLGPLPQHMLKKADRHADKYVRRGKLDWPDGATSRESIRAVLKLPRLQNLVMQHVDHSAGDLIHLLQGLLRYDPLERLTAREALRHSFFTRDLFRR